MKPEPQETILEDTKLPLANVLSGNSNFDSVKNEPDYSNANLVCEDFGYRVARRVFNLWLMWCPVQGEAMKNGVDGYYQIPNEPQDPTPKLSFSVFENAQAIDYIPEGALKEGIGMVKSIKDALKKLQLGSKLRQDVWAREINKLAQNLSLATVQQY